jgi:hypothetical protein
MQPQQEQHPTFKVDQQQQELTQDWAHRLNLSMALLQQAVQLWAAAAAHRPLHLYQMGLPGTVGPVAAAVKQHLRVSLQQ